jgi:hypothetical protein
MTEQSKATVTIIPATPGWCVSTLYCDTNHLIDDPIVAWEITRYDARPIPGTAGQREPIRRYVLPISTNGDLDANVTPRIEGWLLRDPTGRYHEWGSSSPKFNTTEEALAHLKRHRPGDLSRRRRGIPQPQTASQVLTDPPEKCLDAH